jgi:predicted metal-dependent hydrolase
MSIDGVPMNKEMHHFKLGNFAVAVSMKDIKHVHLSVYPPEGRVGVSVPLGMTKESVRAFVITKLAWIRRQQAKFRGQEREASREYINRESHYFNGERYLLKVISHPGSGKLKNGVVLKHKTMELHMQPNASVESRALVVSAWYRQQLKQVVPTLIAKYEKRMKVKVAEFGIRKMKTKWGTCNPLAKRIWLNLELAKKPPECLEYIVVHEMTHLLEPSHNERFVALMDKFMPKWRFYKDELNRLPVRHEHWGY